MAYDRDRYDRDRYDRDRYDQDRERDRWNRDRPRRDERGMLDRAGDEVRSWFGDDEAQRRRERDDRERERWEREERWRGNQGWSSERNYGPERSYSERNYASTPLRETGPASEAYRTEGYRDYGDRYGRSYSAPIDRDVNLDRPIGGERPTRDFGPPTFQPYARGSQEFGPEGYGSASAAGTSRKYGGEWQSSERWRVSGPHVGRGPRGYQRSDERIREEINDRLTAHGLVDATDIEVGIQSGEVTLTGFVDSRSAKRAAEDCAEDIQGVREVHNHLRIRSHADDAGVGRTSVLGLTERETQTAGTAASPGQADTASRSRSRNQ
jgi:osmotically-inducible protein OsmY